MKVFRKDNVLEAAKARIEWIFSEFEDVCVSWSGGKDSTVILHLTLEIAEKLGRLPVPVLWIDQEAEWGSVVELAREVFADPRVEPYWLQVPIKLFNSTSHDTEWLMCWKDGDEWMRPREPNSIHENVYGTDRFGEMFNAFFKHHFDGPVANIGGVRAEESPSRAVGLTHNPTYKWVTWGKILNKPRKQFSLYPIYDWSYADVWKAIHDNGWADEAICNELGMEAEELLRLKHTTGFSKLYADTNYRRAWETKAQLRLKREARERGEETV